MKKKCVIPLAVLLTTFGGACYLIAFCSYALLLLGGVLISGSLIFGWWIANRYSSNSADTVSVAMSRVSNVSFIISVVFAVVANIYLIQEDLTTEAVRGHVTLLNCLIIATALLAGFRLVAYMKSHRNYEVVIMFCALLCLYLRVFFAFSDSSSLAAMQHSIKMSLIYILAATIAVLAVYFVLSRRIKWKT